MKYALLALLLMTCYQSIHGGILDCIRRCESITSDPMGLLICKHACFRAATYGGYKKDSYEQCIDHCYTLDTALLSDCKIGCQLLCPTKKGYADEESEVEPSSSNKRKRTSHKGKGKAKE